MMTKSKKSAKSNQFGALQVMLIAGSILTSLLGAKLLANREANQALAAAPAPVAETITIPIQSSNGLNSTILELKPIQKIVAPEPVTLSQSSQ
ncbi:MAG: hypothetical protein AAF485_24695 [Chloroflexota bacterium]